MIVEKLTLDLGGKEARELFLNKKIHLVCAAWYGLTTYGAFATLGGLDSKEAGEMADKVNQANKVDTLYPKLNLTGIPCSQNRDIKPGREMLSKYIRDCFLANEEYVRCPVLIFIFDFDSETSQLAKNVLKEEANIKADFVYTKAILCEAYPEK